MIISPELLDQFREPAEPAKLYPDRPLIVQNMLIQAIRLKWLTSAVPFGQTLHGPDTVWKETLQLTPEGSRVIK